MSDQPRPSEPMVQVPLDLLEGIAQRLWAVGDDVYREQIEPLIDAARASQNDQSLPPADRPLTPPAVAESTPYAPTEETK